MISLSQLLGGRRKKTRRKTTKRSKSRGAGLVGGRRRRVGRPRKSTTRRRRARGLVGGDMALAKVFQAMGGNVDVNPDVLNYYKKAAGSGRRRRGGANTIITKPYEEPITDVYDPVNVYDIGRQYEIQKHLAKYNRERKRDIEGDGDLAYQYAARLPAKKDYASIIRTSARLLSKAREEEGLTAAKDAVKEEVAALKAVLAAQAKEGKGL